jgi:hypothetical protein
MLMGRFQERGPGQVDRVMNIEYYKHTRMVLKISFLRGLFEARTTRFPASFLMLGTVKAVERMWFGIVDEVYYIITVWHNPTFLFLRWFFSDVIKRLNPLPDERRLR